MGANNGRDAHWQKDSEAPLCHGCGVTFSISIRRHHCRNCGYVFCGNCSKFSCTIPMRGARVPVRVCAECFHTLKNDPNFSFHAGDFDRSGEGSVSSAMYDGDGTGFLEQQSHLGVNTAMPVNIGDENGFFYRADGGVVDDNNNNNNNNNNGTRDLKETEAFYNNYSKHMDPSAQTHMDLDKRAYQVEKDRLTSCWAEVRRRAVFTDIVLQQVEVVEHNTEAMYCAEIESIKLQPEHPDLLGVMFPFPEAQEGNADLLMESVEPGIPDLPKGCGDVNLALEQLAAVLLLPPAETLPKNDSMFFRQY